ncbi:MAG: 30S ribosome-binding factor RbfA [bacterium]
MNRTRLSEIKREKKKALFLREVSSFIQKISQDEPVVLKVFVTRVELSADSGICYIYFAGFNGKKDFDEALEILKLYKPSMRSVLAKSLKLRYAPDLVFRFDEKQEKVQKMEELLEKIHEELGEEDED